MLGTEEFQQEDSTKAFLFTCKDSRSLPSWQLVGLGAVIIVEVFITPKRTGYEIRCHTTQKFSYMCGPSDLSEVLCWSASIAGSSFNACTAWEFQTAQNPNYV